MAGIRDGIDRVPETDDDLLVAQAGTNVGFRLLRRVVALLNLARNLVRAAVLRAAQRADRPDDAGMHVRAGACDHACSERGGVEFMLGVQIQRGMHRPHPRGRRRPPMQQVQDVSAHGVVFRLDEDPLAAVAVVVPVREHGAE